MALDLQATLSESDPDAGHRVVLNARFRLRGPIGEGGNGEVFLADDLRDGGTVAVKLAHIDDALSDDRWRREVSALRLLDIPGVVRLIDAGVEGQTRIIAMELVEGRPFPGCATPCSWDTIAATSCRLLEILVRVHEVGVLHRDLKPSNVLVRADSEPIVLDFGLARGEALGKTLTRTGAALGTPGYWPPEQLLGRPVDTRADLYSFGVMLYEALSGVIPDREHPGRRISQRFPSLATLAPEVPWAVSQAIDRLVATAPDQRFDSASEVLGALESSRGTPRGIRALPLLGRREELDVLRDALAERRSIDVVGASGTGRTRLVREATRELGARCQWLRSSNEPFGSLAGLVGSVADDPVLRESSLELVQAAIQERLAARMQAGIVAIADPWEGVDAFSQRVLMESSPTGCLVRILDAPEEGQPCVRTAALGAEALKELFVGPDRLLHIREDAALILAERSRGVAASVEAEVRAWQRKGLARWRGDRLSVSRDALDRLRTTERFAPTRRTSQHTRPQLSAEEEELLSWVQLAGEHATIEVLRRVLAIPAWQLEAKLETLRSRAAVARTGDARYHNLVPSLAHLAWGPERQEGAHARLADSLPVGSTARVVHRLLANQPELLAQDAMAAASQLSAEGRHGDGIAVLEAAREALEGASEQLDEPLRRTAAFVALRAQDAAALQRLARSLGGTAGAKGSDDIEALRSLVHAAGEIAGAAGERGRRLIDAIEVRDDPDWETCRLIWKVQAYRGAPLEDEARLLDEVSERARALDSSELLSRLSGWRGLHLYRLGRFEEAAQEHLAAAAGREDPFGELSCLSNAASAFLEAGALERAATIAAQVAQRAAAVRSAHHEGRALWLERSARYRAGEDLDPDGEAIEAASSLGLPYLEANLALLDAAIYWRRSEAHRGGPVAQRAQHAFERMGSREGAALAGALAAAMGAVSRAGATDEILALVPEGMLPGILLQAMALVRVEPGSLDAGLIDRFLATLPSDQGEQRLEVLSVDEIRRALRIE